MLINTEPSMWQFTLHRNVRRNVSKTQLFSGRFGKQRWWYVVVAKTFHREQPLSSLLHCTTALQSSTNQRWLQNFKTKLFQIFSSVVVIQVHTLTRYRPLQWSFTTTIVYYQLKGCVEELSNFTYLVFAGIALFRLCVFRSVSVIFSRPY